MKGIGAHPLDALSRLRERVGERVGPQARGRNIHLAPYPPLPYPLPKGGEEKIP
jgi:hypothetical protein